MDKQFATTVRLSPDELKDVLRDHFGLPQTARISFNTGLIDDRSSTHGFTGADIDMKLSLPKAGTGYNWTGDPMRDR